MSTIQYKNGSSTSVKTDVSRYLLYSVHIHLSLIVFL